MRVDGSLMGIDDKSGALIPEWKRGHFSLLFDGATAPATVLLLDHRKQTIVDLQAEKRRHRPDLDTEARCRSRPSTRAHAAAPLHSAPACAHVTSPLQSAELNIHKRRDWWGLEQLSLHRK